MIHVYLVRRMSWALLTDVVIPVGSWSADLQRSNPESVGFSAERLAFIDKYFAEKVEKGELQSLAICTRVIARARRSTLRSLCSSTRRRRISISHWEIGGFPIGPTSRVLDSPTEKRRRTSRAPSGKSFTAMRQR